MPAGVKNMRNTTFSTSSGTDVKSTSQLKGEAKKSKVENEKNSTTQEYFGKGAGSGPWGGENSAS